MIFKQIVIILSLYIPLSLSLSSNSSYNIQVYKETNDGFINVYNKNITDIIMYDDNKFKMSITEIKYLKQYILKFMARINEGHRLVSDTCESINEINGFMEETKKPKLWNNISYIDNDKILLKAIPNNIRDFMIDQKTKFCKEEKIECGELIVAIKMLDLINAAVEVTVSNSNSEKIMFNLDVIEFDLLYDVYKNALFNVELLANITLAKQKSNIILTKEKFRLKEELHKATIDKIKERLYNTLGEPIQNILSYFTTTISDTAQQLIPELNLETKIIIILILIIILLRK